MKIDGEPWFVAADTCRGFGLDLRSGTGPHLNKLGKSERRAVPPNLLRGKGGNQATLITESGLYKLVMRSDKPEAKDFQPLALRTG